MTAFSSLETEKPLRPLTYRADIDGLRAVAILPVVIYHAGFALFPGGFIGVDVFFVISGYLITGLLLDALAQGRFSIVDFYERRARRILPALTLVVLACLAAGTVIASPHEFRLLAKSAGATALFASNVWFWQSTGGYFDGPSELQPLLHTWSLAVEEQFYIVFPVFLWLLRHRSCRTVLAVVAALCAASLALSTFALSGDTSFAFFLPFTRAWELGLGVLLAVGAFAPPRGVRLNNALALVAVAAILLPAMFYDRSTVFPGLAAVPPCLGAALLIWTGSAGTTVAGKVLSRRPVVFVGRISYSLYLWHWPIFSFLLMASGQRALHADQALLATGLAFGLAVLSWRVVERPFRLRGPARMRRRTVFLAAAAGTAGVLLLSAVILATKGLPQRFPEAVQVAFNATFDRQARRCMDRKPDQGLCAFGSGQDVRVARSGTADFLLWGDSHAAAVMPGLLAAAKARHLTGVLASKASCPPLLGVERGDRDWAPADRCAVFNRSVLRMLRARDDLPTVVLEARWALIAEGTRMPDEFKAPAVLVPANDGPAGKGSAEGNFPLFRRGLTATVDAILATGRRVVLLGPVPEAGFDVPAMVGRRLFWGLPLPRSEASAERYRRVDAVLGDLGRREGVTFVPVWPALCKPACRIALHGRPLYGDGDHLDRFGAETVIAPLIAGYLGPPGGTGRDTALPGSPGDGSARP